MALDKTYWENRYEQGSTGWDTGGITTPIKEYIDQLKNQNLSILIPGSGPSHEAEYIHKKGFQNIHIIDLSELVIKKFKERYPEFPNKNIHIQNIFKHSNQYDIIIEQTCFCALEPKLRNKYLKHIKSLLKPNGKFLGVLFQHKKLSETDGPPFGGDLSYYKIQLSQEWEMNFGFLLVKILFNS